MANPDSASRYDKQVTENCERVLVTLLRGLGPWKDSIYLIGGLAPRYLVPKLASGKVPHVGTGDVDIVMQLEMLAETEAYHTLEENLKKMGFERAENDKGEKVSWRWKTKTERDVSVIASDGKVKPLPTEGKISALNIPHSSMVFDHYEVKEIRAELLGEKGVAVEKVHFADIVSFTCLKAFAVDQRYKNKDAYDLVFCIENTEGGLEAVAKAFQAARKGKHGNVIDEALGILICRRWQDARLRALTHHGGLRYSRLVMWNT
jgi:hypothetical protein